MSTGLDEYLKELSTAFKDGVHREAGFVEEQTAMDARREDALRVVGVVARGEGLDDGRPTPGNFQAI